MSPELRHAAAPARTLQYVKRVVLILSGIVDEPLAELNGATPLQAARLPTLDELARAGRLGTLRCIPPGFPPHGEVALASLLGCDPLGFPMARGPLEALARGIRLNRGDAALRCNLVTASGGVLISPTAGYIPTVEARQLVDALNTAGPAGFELHHLSSYRVLLVWRGAGSLAGLQLTHPFDVLDRPLTRHTPRGRESRTLLKWMDAAAQVLAQQDINSVRNDLGEPPATHIWPYGHGTLSAPSSFESRFGRRALLLTGSDGMRGLGKLMRIETVDLGEHAALPAADFAVIADALLAAWQRSELLIVQVEAIDEVSHLGVAADKVAALERLDASLIAPVFERLSREAAWRLMVVCDRATPVRVRAHRDSPTVLLIAGHDVASSRGEHFDERSAAEGEIHLEAATGLMEYFLKT